MFNPNTRTYITTTNQPSEIKVRKGRVFYRTCYNKRVTETLDIRSPVRTAQDCIDKIIEIQDGKHPHLRNPGLILKFLERKVAKMESFIF